MLIRNTYTEDVTGTDKDPFTRISIRKLSKATKLDIGYLSRVKNNIYPVPPERARLLVAVALEEGASE